MLIAFRSWLVSWPGIIAREIDLPRIQYIHDPLPKRVYTYLDFFLITTRNFKKQATLITLQVWKCLLYLMMLHNGEDVTFESLHMLASVSI